jgi:hypothetical protein
LTQEDKYFGRDLSTLWLAFNRLENQLQAMASTVAITAYLCLAAQRASATISKKQSVTRMLLGYWSVEAWPIYKNNTRNTIMYYMIHATDHPAAPYAMQTAYAKAVGPEESPAEVQT